jgi:hypothetical protein
MSLDFSLIRSDCLYSGNITHNVAPMWSLAGCYDALYNSEGKEARELIPVLEKAVEEMGKYPSEYIKLNPLNGWGSYPSALEYLKEVLKSCKYYPDLIVSISK